VVWGASRELLAVTVGDLLMSLCSSLPSFANSPPPNALPKRSMEEAPPENDKDADLLLLL